MSMFVVVVLYSKVIKIESPSFGCTTGEGTEEERDRNADGAAGCPAESCGSGGPGAESHAGQQTSGRCDTPGTNQNCFFTQLPTGFLGCLITCVLFLAQG